MITKLGINWGLVPKLCSRYEGRVWIDPKFAPYVEKKKSECQMKRAFWEFAHKSRNHQCDYSMGLHLAKTQNSTCRSNDNGIGLPGGPME